MKIESLDYDHWIAVADIYQQGISDQIATFETSVPSWEQWDSNHLTHCRFIAIINEEIVGWAALSPTSTRIAYKGVCEVSIYISNNYKGKLIGYQLLKQLIHCSEKHGIWTLQAVMFKKNFASIRLHEKCGFRLVGFREKIAQQNETWIDTVIYERRSMLF